jgi:hypothetical protein
VVAVSPVLRELIIHLAREPQTDSPARRRVEAVVSELVASVPAATVDVPLPTDPRTQAAREKVGVGQVAHGM